MGVYTDLLAGAKSWDAGNSDGTVATDRVITQQIERFQARQGDVPAPSEYAEADEVQEIAAFVPTVSSGNFTLTVNIAGAALTTANIAFDATAAAIESAIDTVCSGNVAGWTNGDISVALTGDLTANPATLTYDGTSVDATNHPAIIISDVDLGGGGSPGAVTTTTNGQTVRLALAALNVMGIIDSPPPEQGTTTVVATTTRASNPYFPGQETLQALAMQAAIDDDTGAIYGTLMAAMGLGHLV